MSVSVHTWHAWSAEHAKKKSSHDSQSSRQETEAEWPRLGCWALCSAAALEQMQDLEGPRPNRTMAQGASHGQGCAWGLSRGEKGVRESPLPGRC